MPEVIAKGDLGPLKEDGPMNDNPPEQQERLRKKGKKAWRRWTSGKFLIPSSLRTMRLHRTRRIMGAPPLGLVDIEGGLDPCEPTHRTPTHGILSSGGSNPIEAIDADQTEKFQDKSEQIMTDTLIHYGSGIKTVEETETGWKFGGYLVVFDSPDISRHRDVFTRFTDIACCVSARTITFYHKFRACITAQISPEPADDR